MTKIAVTGCAGFVGSWICEKALAAGYEIVGIDNLTSDVDYTPKEVEFHKLDVNGNIQSVLSNVDAVVHAAAYAELRHNWQDISERERLFTNNEIATRSILEKMPDVPIIFLSTGAVYGSLSNKSVSHYALTEDNANPGVAESPYAASKLACEAYVAAWAYKKKIPWHSLRLVNQVGLRSHRGVITDFCRMARDTKHIHAADNGKQTKNWVSVEDTADAVVRLLDTQNVVPSGIYNVTSTERWSWRDIVRVMREVYAIKHPNEEPFKLTNEDILAGSIGDPINLHVSGDKLNKYYSCDRSVDQAVRDALKFINWGD